MRKIDRVKRRLITEGFAGALTGKKPDRAYSRKIDDDFEAKSLNCIAVSLPRVIPGDLYAYWPTGLSNSGISMLSPMKAFVGS